MGQVIFSVIVPVFQAAKYVSTCIDSILFDQGDDIEVIIIDDGSTDGSGDICEKYAKTDHRVKVIHQPNGGVSRARNRGLMEVSGKWIWFVDADDYVEENAFKMWRKAIKLNCDTIISGMNHHTPAGDYKIQPPYSTDNKDSILETTSCYQNGMILFSSEIIKKHHITFSSDIKMGEDMEFQYIYLINCKTPVCTGDIHYNYCVRSESATTGINSHRNNAFDSIRIAKNLLDYSINNDIPKSKWLSLRMNRIIKSGLNSARYLDTTLQKEYKQRLCDLTKQYRKCGFNMIADNTIILANINLNAYFALSRLYQAIKA